MSLPRVNVHFEMSDEDREFFELHWIQWVAKNPPPEGWTDKWSIKEWAETEMPCVGLLGRALYWLSMIEVGKDGDDNIGL